MMMNMVIHTDEKDNDSNDDGDDAPDRNQVPSLGMVPGILVDNSCNLTPLAEPWRPCTSAM